MKRKTVSYPLTEPILVGLYWAIYHSGLTHNKVVALNEIITLLGYKPE